MERNRHPLSAVIFDYGNVLSEVQVSADIDAMAALLGLERPQFQEVYWRFRVAYDEAELDPESYWQAIAEATDRTLTAKKLASLRRLDIRSWIQPNPAMVEWAKQVRSAGVKTAVLSNMPADLLAYLRGPESWLPEFDTITFSCELGCSKPTPAIYENCLQGLGVPAAQALFLDDREPNVEGARKLGMHGLLFTDAQTAAPELERFELPALAVHQRQ